MEKVRQLNLRLTKDEALWIREMLDVYLTCVKRDESNQKRGRDLIKRIEDQLNNIV